MKSVIYQIRNIVNDKVYVGSAIDEAKRWQQHRRSLNNRTHFNQYLQNSWNKYGAKNFLFETLEELHEDDHDKLKNFLIERETFWIDTKHSADQNFGYNICSTGSNALGVKRSEKTKKLMSASKIGEKNPMYGKPATGCFTGLRGEKNWNYGKTDGNSPNAKPVIQYSLNGEFIKEWSSQSEIRKSSEFSKFGNQSYRITRCLKGQCPNALGFKWKFKNKIHTHE